ncbi:MAG TPA: segregation/condensation protein A [bacterium]|nr:segregation/condensation protein A [bacterium]
MKILSALKLKLAGFVGRLEELVSAVKTHVMDILDVRLGDAARQLADAARTGGHDTMRFTPFLSLARLMFIKSRNLLPGQDQFEETDLEAEEVQPEEEPTEVRERLKKQQHRFQEVAMRLRVLEETNATKLRSRRTRSEGLPEFIDEISFLEQATPFDLMQTMIQLLRMKPEERLYRVRVDDAKLLSMRISEVFDFLLARRGEPALYSEIVSAEARREEKALSFLAVLFLLNQGRITAEQSAPYADIEIRVRQAEGGAG